MSDFKYAWIKLYTEILHDPKMAKLDDHLWRRAVEIFLLAGEHSEDGVLPSVEDMAWAVRSDEETFEKELETLAQKIGLEHDPESGVWVVSNFAKRQAALTSTERARKARGSNELIVALAQQNIKHYATESSQEGNGLCNDNATKTLQTHNETVAEVDKKKIRIDKKRIEEEEDPQKKQNSAAAATKSKALVNGVSPEVWKAYSNNVGNLTPMISAALSELEAKYGGEWLLMAMEEAIKSNARNINYITAILKRWGVDGFKSRFESGKYKHSGVGQGRGGLRGSDLDDALAKIVAEADNG